MASSLCVRIRGPPFEDVVPRILAHLQGPRVGQGRQDQAATLWHGRTAQRHALANLRAPARTVGGSRGAAGAGMVLDDLGKVPGIGPSTTKAIRDLVR